jgi:ribonuclease HIII
MEMRDLILKDEPVSQLDAYNRHEEFRLAYSGGIIVGYRTGKVVSNTPECAALIYRTIQKMHFEDERFAITIGSDEAGKGEWLGPLTIAAVALTPQQSKHLRALGIMDSKGLPRHRIAQKAQDIVGHCEAKHVLVISPYKFNKMFADFKEEGKNLNDILAWAHSRTISEAYDCVKQDFANSDIQIVVDEFARVKTRNRISQVMNLSEVNLVQKHGAEGVIAVAAASILARDAYELWLTRNSEKLSIDLRSLSESRIKARADVAELAKIEYLSNRRQKA